MSYEQKENTATIWQNIKSKENHPDYKGTINVNGTELEIALWKKTSSGGKNFLGGTIQPKREKQAEKPHQKPVESDPFDGDIPF